MYNSSSGGSAGISLPTLLTVLFVGLKLTHHIDWSWWWVLSPVWISVSLAGLLVALYLVLQ